MACRRKTPVPLWAVALGAGLLVACSAGPTAPEPELDRGRIPCQIEASLIQWVGGVPDTTAVCLYP